MLLSLDCGTAGDGADGFRTVQALPKAAEQPSSAPQVPEWFQKVEKEAMQDAAPERKRDAAASAPAGKGVRASLLCAFALLHSATIANAPGTAILLPQSW